MFENKFMLYEKVRERNLCQVQEMWEKYSKLLRKPTEWHGHKNTKLTNPNNTISNGGTAFFANFYWEKNAIHFGIHVKRKVQRIPNISREANEKEKSENAIVDFPQLVEMRSHNFIIFLGSR